METLIRTGPDANDVEPRRAWSVAGGSVTGREHLRVGRNNQDAWGIARRNGLLVAAVADGCSSAAHSEVGAQLAVRWMLAELPARWPQDADALAADCCEGLLGYWRDLVSPLGAECIADLLLTTVLVAVVDGERAVVFGIGDGIVAVDDDRLVLTAGAANAPAYLAYRMLPDEVVEGGTAWCRPRVHVESRCCRRLAIATDGCAPLLEGDALDALLVEPRIFRNRSLLQKRLRQASQERAFGDDATLVVLQGEGEPCRS